MPAADDLEEPVDLAAWLVEHPAASYVMRVQDWSMSGANISDGDHVVVDRSVEPRAGHIVVALVHGDRTMKRLRRRDDCELARAIDADEQIELAFSSLHLGDIDVEEADWLALEALPFGLVAFDIWQPGDTVPFEATMQR